MNFKVSGHHVSVTPAIRDYVHAKLARINRHFDHVIDVNVILSVEKLAQKAEVSVHLRGRDIHVETVDENLYAAIDTLADKLDRQILKYKDKTQNHQHEAPKRAVT
ncbi:MAG: ribosome-associated translation inhibitor RaiA [Burkholderiales bacterium]|nr:ribosome-associated translation inhibitor RaiA [Burkholderiales bacterium]